MSIYTPRLRMFAGPNGSGKSTFKTMIRRELLGVYINPDEIEKEIRERGFIDFNAYQVTTSKQEILDFFKKSSLLEKSDPSHRKISLDSRKANSKLRLL